MPVSLQAPLVWLSMNTVSLLEGPPFSVAPLRFPTPSAIELSAQKVSSEASDTSCSCKQGTLGMKDTYT
jgi:hypothetical protein